MQIHSQTDGRLEIRHRPIFWAVVFGCLLFVLAGWAMAGLSEGEWLGALFPVGIGGVMGWLVFRRILVSFSIVLDRKADHIAYQDSKNKEIDVPFGRLTSVRCDAQLNTDNGEAERSLVRLDLAFDPAIGVIEMKRSNLLGTTIWLLPLRHFDGAELIERALPLEQLRNLRKHSANVDLLFGNTRPNMTISLSAFGIPEVEAKRITSRINDWMQELAEAKASASAQTRPRSCQFRCSCCGSSLG